MRTLIAFGTKTGTTRKCAQILQKKLGFGDIADVSLPLPPLSQYDLIIVGGPIRMGKLDKSVRKFIDDNRELLKSKKTAYYICSGLPGRDKENLKQAYSDELLDRAITSRGFGGELDSEKLRGLDRFIAKMAAKNNGKPAISEEDIDIFAKIILRKTA